MKKVSLVLLLAVIALVTPLTGCASDQEEARDKVIYIHDEVHEVGIWFVTAEGKFGGRHIFVLPDREYSNPGEDW